MKKLWQKLSLFLGYNTSSFVTFLLELGVLYICLNGAHLSYYLAVPVAFITTTLVHYAICHLWVFDLSGRTLPFEYGYFMFILGSGLLWTLLLVALLVQAFGMGVIIARVLAGIFTSIWNFYLNARFNFRSRSF